MLIAEQQCATTSAGRLDLAGAVGAQVDSDGGSDSDTSTDTDTGTGTDAGSHRCILTTYHLLRSTCQPIDGSKPSNGSTYAFTPGGAGM